MFVINVTRLRNIYSEKKKTAEQEDDFWTQVMVLGSPMNRAENFRMVDIRIKA